MGLVLEGEARKLITMRNRLRQYVIGQDARWNMKRCIRRNRAGFPIRVGPSGICFLGPTGVGKTELARTRGVFV